MLDSIKVAAIQHSCSSDSTANLQIDIDAIGQAAAEGAQLIVLQELHSHTYFCFEQNASQFDRAETIPGPTTDKLAALAAQHSVVIIGSIFEKRTAGIYHNTAVVFDRDGSIAGLYRKMHIPDDPGYNEKFYFTPGDLGFEPIKTSLLTLGVLVCWDQWFPEAARLMALSGAQLLVYPSAIGHNPSDTTVEQQRQLDAWLISQRAHAVANGLPLISCNRTGIEPGNQEKFWGHSFVCGAQGELLAQASTEAEVIAATIDLQNAEKVRREWPFLRDRRIDAYSDLLKRFKQQ